MIKVYIGAAILAIIAGLGWQITNLNKKIDEQNKTIGGASAENAQHVETIIGYMKTVESFVDEIAIRDRIAVDNQAQQEKILLANTTLQNEIERLKRESKTANDYFSTVIPSDVYNSMFDHAGSANGNEDRNSNQATSSKVPD